MKQRVLSAVFILLFVFTVAMLAATIRDKRQLREERKSLILQNDSLHILQLEAKQKMMQIKNRLDSMENRNNGHLKNENLKSW